MIMISRKSLAELIYESVEDNDPRPHVRKLVIYDFKGDRIPRKLYFDLHKLLELAGDGFAVQYSAVLVEEMRTARAIEELARSCGCQKVRIYAVKELE